MANTLAKSRLAELGYNWIAVCQVPFGIDGLVRVHTELVMNWLYQYEMLSSVFLSQSHLVNSNR